MSILTGDECHLGRMWLVGGVEGASKVGFLRIAPPGLAMTDLQLRYQPLRRQNSLQVHLHGSNLGLLVRLHT